MNRTLGKVASFFLLNLVITLVRGQHQQGGFYSGNPQVANHNYGGAVGGPAAGYVQYAAPPNSFNANAYNGYGGGPQVPYAGSNNVASSYPAPAPVQVSTGYTSTGPVQQQQQQQQQHHQGNYANYVPAPSAASPTNAYGFPSGYSASGSVVHQQQQPVLPNAYAPVSGHQGAAAGSALINNQNGVSSPGGVQVNSFNVPLAQGNGGAMTYSGSAPNNPINAGPTAQIPNNQFSNRQLPFGGPGAPNGVPIQFGGPVGLPAPVPTAALPFGAIQAQPTAGPQGLPQQSLMNRRGPFDAMMNRAKEWMPGLKKNRGKPFYSNVGAHDSHRLPKPPKYPLYDMPSTGMATPPPAPLMSPMSAMPSDMYSSYGGLSASGSSPVPQSNMGSIGGPNNRGGRPSQPPPPAGRRSKNGKRRRTRPGPPPPPPPPPAKYRGNKRGQRPKGKGRPPKTSITGPRNSYMNTVVHDGYDHPMASNTIPVNSPPLGRPLGFDEYMKQPSHSFTDDPWNFDPNAQSYNEGMNTHAMKYNYDPLGMNTLDMSVQTHLDASKMSYPGDVMQMETMNQPPKPLSSQIGGWDAPPESYRTTPHRAGSAASSSSNFDDQSPEGSSFNYDDTTTSTTSRNSFNQYDGSVTESSNSDAANPLSMFSSPDGATIEFDMDALKGISSGNDRDQQNNKNNDYDNKYKSGSSHSSSSSSSNYDNYKSNSNNNYDDYRSGNRDREYDTYKSGSRNNDYEYKSSSSSSSSPASRRNEHRDYYERERYPDETPAISDYSRGEKTRNSGHSSSYDRYSSSDYSRYGSRHVRAHANSQFVHRSNGPVTGAKTVEADEGISMFHDFIKDPNPGTGKAKARQTLYKALLS